MFIYLFYLALTFFIQIETASTVFKAPDCFYAQRCLLGIISTGPGTYGCQTQNPQTNVIKYTLALSQLSKKSTQIIHFQASVSPTGDQSVYTISCLITQPISSTIRLGFFLILIKSQPINMLIDFIDFNVDSLSPLNNFNTAPVTTYVKSYSISVNSMFSSSSGLSALSFTKSYKMTPDPSGDGIYNQSYMTNTFNLVAGINVNNVDITVQVQDHTALIEIQGFALLYKQTLINTLFPSKLYVGSYSLYNNNNNYNMSSFVSAFGPPFNSKCFLGISFHRWRKTNNIYYYFKASNKGNFQTYAEYYDQSAPFHSGNIFCFGNSTECQQQWTYVDVYNPSCYIGSTCPLPIPSGWNLTDLCPNCTQLVCKVCNTNRSQCTLCKNNTNTYLNTTINRCKCIPNHYEVTFAISTSNLGEWNNQSASLLYCKVNCTEAIIGCTFGNCTNSSYCIDCATSYYLKWISITHQTCQLCSVPTSNCINCTNSTNCFNCDLGYYLGNSSTACICNHSLILNCTACTVAYNCSICQPGYYVNTTTGNCTLCSNIAPACTLCSNFTNCTACTNTTYTLDSYTVSSFTVCSLCNILIPNCTQCSTPTTCTNCDLYYGVTSSMGCQGCDLLLNIPGCVTCEDNITCLSCNNTTFLLRNDCLICYQQISNCKDCVIFNSSFLDYDNCSLGYYIVYDNQTNYHECKSCANIYDHCFECDPSSTGCTSCLFPYVMGSSGACDQCVSGYQQNSGFCMKLAGCQSSVILANGTQICVACIPQLNFIYSTSLKKCTCKSGYKQIIPLGMLAQCVHICGDGILSLPEEQCDDHNFINNDGCDQNCQTQPDFKCNFQPSQCVLHLNIKVIIFSYAYRVISENKGMIYYHIEPKHIALQNMKWDKLITFNLSHTALDFTSLKYSYQVSTGQLQISFTYKEELQNIYLQTQILLNPKYIVSSRSSFTMVNRLNGVNFPLNIESDLLLSTHKNINLISLVIMILLLLQFYVGSYFHKMIGLQTIQCIQIMYFVRMLVYSNAKNIMSSMNNLKYSASGYQNSEIIFGLQKELQPYEIKAVASQFLIINLHKYFLLNANFCLIPLIIVIVVYCITLGKKYHYKKFYIEDRQPENKKKYVNQTRSSQWVYDHFVFPMTIMFNPVVLFTSIIKLSVFQNLELSQNSFQSVQFQSFLIHSTLFIITLTIFASELLKSYEDYKKHTMTAQQKSMVHLSFIQTIQRDQNNIDRANYHPFYLFLYLMYFTLIWILMVLEIFFQSFSFSLQCLLGLEIFYFLSLFFWKPYHQVVNFHNHILKLNHFFVCVFLSFCVYFEIMGEVSEASSIIIVYVIEIMISLIILGGFFRTIKQKNFRRILQQNNSILLYGNNGQVKQLQDNDDPQNIQNQQTNILLKKNRKNDNPYTNKYSFINQIKDTAKNLGFKKITQAIQNQKNISQEEQRMIRKKMRQQYMVLNQNMLIDQIIRQQQNWINKNQNKKQQLTQKQQYNIQVDQLIQDLQKKIQNVQERMVKGNKIKNRTQSNQLKLLKCRLKKQWNDYSQYE